MLPFHDNDVIKGNLTLLASLSETETFVVRFRPEHLNVTICIGLKVTHSRGRISDVSNMCVLLFGYVDVWMC